MNKIMMLMLLITSQSLYAGVGDGSGAGAAPENAFMEQCMASNAKMEQSKARLMCENALIQKSSEEGTGKPSTDEGTGRT